MPSAVLIANSGARLTAETFAKARSELIERGVHLTMTHVVDNPRELCRCVRRSIENGSELIIVAGGDGTMTAAVGQLAKTKAVLGVLPLGTGNSFALSLGITELSVAIEAIVAGRVAAVDLGRVNGTYFANFATIGLSSTIARATPNRLKKIVARRRTFWRACGRRCGRVRSAARCAPGSTRSPFRRFRPLSPTGGTSATRR